MSVALNHNPENDPSDHAALPPLRSAVILVCALLVGAVVGGLTYAGMHQLPSASLAGCFAFGGAVLWFHKVIAT
jgi:hypothetical protein